MLMLHEYSFFLFTALQFLHLHCFNLDVTHTIIYEDPSKSAGMRGSYFGFSLLLYSGSSKTKPWIQIGAPRGNDTNMYKGVKEPGVVYRCPISDTCKTVALDKIPSGRKVVDSTKQSYVDDKNGGWIGGAMDMDEKDGRVVVCGHRWGNWKKEEQFYYMLGVCYGSNVDQSISDPSRVSKLIPLHKQEDYFHSYGDNPFYLLNYGVGQAGFSVHFPKDKKRPELLIGAPGVSNWKGSAVLYEARDNNRYGNYTFNTVLNPKSLDVQQYTLFGYQVNSGKFDNSDKYYYVAGNPKGNNKGKVYVYTYKNDYSTNIVKRLDGYQIGEYFGSSLAVADVDCDGIDDLIVGAPQYTVNHDEGRIYIFISSLQDTVFKSPIFITGKIVGGRFGTSVTAIGDLDNDRCDDIAIGAPYAKNNTGVIYIFSGNPRGPILSQEINADEIHPELKGFGISISRGTDIDDNGYPDVAVGAFLSDQAVIFRAQPVVYLNTGVTARVDELQKDAKSFVITVCLSYTGTSEHVPNMISVLRNIIVDEKLRRAHFVDKRNILNSTIVIKNKINCENIEVFLLKTALEENTSDPVNVKVTQEIINSGGGTKTVVFIGSHSSIKSKDDFRKDFPVVNERRSSQSTMLNVPFATECGDHNECEAELQLNYTFSGLKNGVYVIGSNSRLKLDVNVTNKKQPAYRTVVNITIPFPILLSSGHKSCTESISEYGLSSICNFGNPLRNGTVKNLTLNLDTGGLRPGSKNLTFFISVTTSSTDKNKAHNSQQLPLNFIVEADMIIIGRSEELVYNYAKSNKTVFKHRYEVQKRGSSAVEVAKVELNIPARFTGPNDKTFLEIYRPQAYLNNEQELACSSEEYYEYHSEENIQRVESLDINLRQKREAVLNELELQTNQTLFLNCSIPNVHCIKITCYAGPFDSDLQASASIELKMIMNISNLGQALGEKTAIYLSTQGSVSIKEPKIIQLSQRVHRLIINTTFVNSTYTEGAVQSVETWIIALSVIAGIFILMFVVIGFMKAGFFERKKKEQLKSLMAVYATNVFTVGMAPKTPQIENNDDDDDDSACDSRDELKQEESEEL